MPVPTFLGAEVEGKSRKLRRRKREGKCWVRKCSCQNGNCFVLSARKGNEVNIIDLTFWELIAGKRKTSVKS